MRVNCILTKEHNKTGIHGIYIHTEDVLTDTLHHPRLVNAHAPCCHDWSGSPSSFLNCRPVSGWSSLIYEYAGYAGRLLGYGTSQFSTARDRCVIDRKSIIVNVSNTSSMRMLHVSTTGAKVHLRQSKLFSTIEVRCDTGIIRVATIEFYSI
jgi:hypothetical protein